MIWESETMAAIWFSTMQRVRNFPDEATKIKFIVSFLLENDQLWNLEVLHKAFLQNFDNELSIQVYLVVYGLAVIHRNRSLSTVHSLWFLQFYRKSKFGYFYFFWDTLLKTQRIPLGSPYNHVLRTRRLVRLETRYAPGLRFNPEPFLTLCIQRGEHLHSVLFSILFNFHFDWVPVAFYNPHRG